MFHFHLAKQDTTSEVGIEQGLFFKRNVLPHLCNQSLEAGLQDVDPSGKGVPVYE